MSYLKKRIESLDVSSAKFVQEWKRVDPASAPGHHRWNTIKEHPTLMTIAEFSGLCRVLKLNINELYELIYLDELNSLGYE